MRTRSLIAAVFLMSTALAGMPAEVSAEPFNVAASGKWTAVNPPNVVGLEGVNTNRIKWGTPADATQGGNGQKSSYQFVGNNLAGLTEAMLTAPGGFVLGTFTHFNFIINDAPAPFSILGATLDVAVQFTDTGPTPGVLDRDFFFNFTHTETPNGASPCPDPDGMAPFPPQPCPDIVSFESAFSQESVMIGGTTYVLQIIGFQVGQQVVTNFLTTEGQQNDAQLIARLSLPPPRAPEPATLGVLGLGLAVFGAYRLRRRKAA